MSTWVQWTATHTTVAVWDRATDHLRYSCCLLWTKSTFYYNNGTVFPSEMAFFIQNGG